MLCLTCPVCGVAAEETELSPGGEAHIARAVSDGDEALRDYLFQRRNPRGVHLERWRHVFGCGKWFHAARSTQTLEVFGTYAAHLPGPPDDILAAIKARHPDWSLSS